MLRTEHNHLTDDLGIPVGARKRKYGLIAAVALGLLVPSAHIDASMWRNRAVSFCPAYRWNARHTHLSRPLELLEGELDEAVSKLDWLEENWAQVLRQYEGKFVLVSERGVLFAGDTYRAVYEYALSRGVEFPLIIKAQYLEVGLGWG